MFMSQKALPLVVFACLASTWSSLLAVRPQKWTISTFQELEAGKSEGVSITSDGSLMLAPGLQQVLDTKEAFIYSAVFGSQGDLFVGTGNNGWRLCCLK